MSDRKKVPECKSTEEERKFWDEHDATDYLVGSVRKRGGGDPFTREIVGALKATMHDHGPIGKEQVGSAAKRIASQLREAMKRERDLLARSQPKCQERE